MDYALRPGLHFCEVSGRLIFLDLIADRYLCLSERAEAAFRKIWAGTDPIAGNDQAAAMLVKDGMLRFQPGAALKPCEGIEVPDESALDLTDANPGIGRSLSTLVTLCEVRVALRLYGLAKVVNSLSLLKKSASRADLSFRVISEAAALEATARWTRSHDQCLVRSVAAARRLARQGCSVDLVLGVRLRPFAAHAWAQTPDLLVNDRFDYVRSYQPILVV